MGKEAVEKGSSVIGPKIAEILASSPKAQLVGATTGGLSAGGAREMGASPGAQLAAGLIGGITPAAAIDSVPTLIRKIMLGGAAPQDVAENINTFKSAGASPSVGQATEARVPRWIESTLSRLPGGAGVMANRSEQQAASIGERVEDIASSLAGRTEPTTTGMKIEKGITENFIPKSKQTQKTLYEKLDSYIPAEDEILATNTLSTLQNLDSSIPGAPSVSQALGNKSISAIKKAFEDDMGIDAGDVNSYFTTNSKTATKGTMPYDSIKRIRTKIGEQLSDFQLTSDIPRSQLKRLYAGLTQDMEAAAKAAGPEAYAAFKRANKYTSSLHDRIDLLQSVVDKSGGPEKVFQAAISGTREGATTFKSVMKALPEDGRKALTSTVLRRMGVAKPGKQNELGDVMKFSKRSLNNLKGVHPHLIEIMMRAIEITEIDFMVIEGLRTKERQAELVKAGASWTMNSRHITGHAVDIVPLLGGEVRWDWPIFYKLAPYIKAAARDCRHPITWGGDWKKFRDGPHWELPRSKYP